MLFMFSSRSCMKIMAILFLFLKLTTFLSLPSTKIAKPVKPPLFREGGGMVFLLPKFKEVLADDIRVNLLPATKGTYGVGFLVNFTIGDPPIQHLSVMDTGSSFIWVQCTPCKDCPEQQGAVFDPSNSSTYYLENCFRSSCNRTYDTHILSKGGIGYEKLQVFEASTGDNMMTLEVVLGCLAENQPHNEFGQWNGVFGLGTGVNSIPNKLGRFSYCIGNVNDTSNSYYNRLNLGRGAILEGQSTPFRKEKGLYYVNLEDISIGDERLHIDPNAFKEENSEGGVVIDSVTTFSFLPGAVYDMVREKISSILAGGLKQVVYHEKEPWVLCYNGDTNRDLQGLPVLTFHFAEGANLVLDARSLFYQEEENVFCISIRPSSNVDSSIVERRSSRIGIMAQQYYNVGFELKEERIYFLRIDCQLLDD